ncbi:hypothetical protein Q8A67_002239 [Cirrhinus molitorella]|uniref:Uncharacterized protein n=1 Tax=Cirrhinus molitorella TaxID=172907 RepID=A0AA88TZ69_9TELE|nr:hypothetical protein Q8A67_002239 [Cirrhinus molitorella]
MSTHTGGLLVRGPMGITSTVRKPINSYGIVSPTCNKGHRYSNFNDPNTALKGDSPRGRKLGVARFLRRLNPGSNTHGDWSSVCASTA